MFRMTSQLCEVFDCTDQQLKDSGVLEAFNAWLLENPDQHVSNSLKYGEMINGDIAERFFEFYKVRKSN